MYHGLVRINGEWVSFGLHVPSPRWTNTFQTHRLAYGQENVHYLFWKPNDRVVDIRAILDRVQLEVRLANMAQSQWDVGELPRATGDEDKLNLTVGIDLLWKATL